MNAKQRERIDTFIASGARPKRTSSGATIARQQGGRFQTLVDARGERTPAGVYYEGQSQQTLSVGGFDTSQSPQRTGNTEYVTMRDGSQRVTRRWDPASQEFKFTAFGRIFYARLKRSYVVQLPVRIRGERKDGSTYAIRSTLPIAKLGLDRVEMPLNLTTSQRNVKIKQIVCSQLDLTKALYQEGDLGIRRRLRWRLDDP